MFIPKAISRRAPAGDLTTANCAAETSEFINALRNECVCNAQEVKMVLEHQALTELNRKPVTRQET